MLAHNRDDHAKNFSFLMDADGQWRLSPAYDLTFSTGVNGQQSTTVMGEGRRPSEAELIALGREVRLAESQIDDALEQVRAALAEWPALASQYGVATRTKQNIAAALP